MAPVRLTASRVLAKELNPTAAFIAIEQNQYDLPLAQRRRVPRRFLVLIPESDPGAPTLAQVVIRHLNETFEIDSQGNWKRK